MYSKSLCQPTLLHAQIPHVYTAYAWPTGVIIHLGLLRALVSNYDSKLMQGNSTARGSKLLCGRPTDYAQVQMHGGAALVARP